MNRGYRKNITPEKNDSLKRARYEALYSDNITGALKFEHY